MVWTQESCHTNVIKLNMIVPVSVAQARIGISFDLFMTFDNLSFIDLQSHSEIYIHTYIHTYFIDFPKGLFKDNT